MPAQDRWIICEYAGAGFDGRCTPGLCGSAGVTIAMPTGLGLGAGFGLAGAAALAFLGTGFFAVAFFTVFFAGACFFMPKA